MNEERFTIIAETEDVPGVLLRVTSVFTRRRLNIESLTVSKTAQEGYSRFTIVLSCSRARAEKVTKQIAKIVEVRNAAFFDDSMLVFDEVAFIRVSAESIERRAAIEQALGEFNFSTALTNPDSILVAVTGNEQEIDRALAALEQFGVKEFVRSGRTAIKKHQGDLRWDRSFKEQLCQPGYQ